MKFKYVVVGAGLAGITIAERIATQLHEKVLIIEKRPQIGGNVYDEYNDAGILIQKYGPHTFHTNDKEVFDYVCQYCDWHEYQHRVMSYVNGNFVPMPISLETINQLYNMNLSEDGMDAFIESRKIKIDEIKTSEDVVLSQGGQDIYEKFFKYFTIKQWGVSPAELESIKFIFETHDCESYQPVASTRWPMDYDYTRITEFKKLTGQKNDKTTILKEIPCDGEEPFYTFPTAEWKALAQQYRDLATQEENVIFLGRLAEYKYYDMDNVIRRSLDVFSEIDKVN